MMRTLRAMYFSNPSQVLCISSTENKTMKYYFKVKGLTEIAKNINQVLQG